MLALARREGFEAGIVETGKSNSILGFGLLCGKSLRQVRRELFLSADCGTPEEMRARIVRYPRALVFRSEWPIADYQDQEAIRLAKREHNGGMLRAIDQMRAAGIEGTMAGASNCTLCARCKILDNAPCPFPERRFSCLSASACSCASLRALRHGVRRGRRHRLLRAVCLRAQRGFRTRLRPPAAPQSLPRAFALSTDALRNFDSAALSSGAMRDAVVRFALSADARRPFPRPPRA